MADRIQRDATIRVDDLEITTGEGLVGAGGRVLTLSVRELVLLVAMVDRAGGIVCRAELCRAVWGRQPRAGDRSVESTSASSAPKLEHAVPGRRYIHTHPSFGSRFQPEPADEPDAAHAEGAQGGHGTPSGPGAPGACTNLVMPSTSPTDAEER